MTHADAVSGSFAATLEDCRFNYVQDRDFSKTFHELTFTEGKTFILGYLNYLSNQLALELNKNSQWVSEHVDSRPAQHNTRKYGKYLLEAKQVIIVLLFLAVLCLISVLIECNFARCRRLSQRTCANIEHAGMALLPAGALYMKAVLHGICLPQWNRCTLLQGYICNT